MRTGLDLHSSSFKNIGKFQILFEQETEQNQQKRELRTLQDGSPICNYMHIAIIGVTDAMFFRFHIYGRQSGVVWLKSELYQVKDGVSFHCVPALFFLWVEIGILYQSVTASCKWL